MILRLRLLLRLVLLALELRESRGEVAGVDFLVWGILGAHNPTVGRAGRGTDEEELVELGGFEEFGAVAVAV